MRTVMTRTDKLFIRNLLNAVYLNGTIGRLDTKGRHQAEDIHRRLAAELKKKDNAHGA